MDTQDEETQIRRYIDIAAIESLTAQARHFSPNGDQVQDQTTIRADLSLPISWRLRVTDRPGREHHVFEGTDRRVAQIWDGKNGQDEKLPDGDYLYELSLLHPITRELVLTQMTFGRLDTIAPLAELAAPSNDSVVAGATTIRGTTFDLNFDRWVLDVAASSAPRRWEILRTSEQQTDDEPLANLEAGELFEGAYIIRLRAWDQAGNLSRSRHTVQVLNFLLLLRGSIFSPNDDGLFDTLSLNGAFTIPADWDLLILDADGQTVRTFTGTGSELRQAWDGKDTAGNRARWRLRGPRPCSTIGKGRGRSQSGDGPIHGG